MLQKQELDRIDKGWPKIMLIWIALLSPLVFYLVICNVVGNQISVSMEGSHLEVLKYALFGVSAMTLAGAYFFRKFMINKIAHSTQGVSIESIDHPAVARYIVSCQL